MASKKKAEKVSVELDAELCRGVAAEMVRMRRTAPGKPTKAGAVKAILKRGLRGGARSKAAREEAHREMLREARAARDEAKDRLAEGRGLDASKAFLKAAQMEIEALRVLVDPSEEEMKSTLIEVVGLLKDATGYKHLPDVPRARRDYAGPAV